MPNVVYEECLNDDIIFLQRGFTVVFQIVRVEEDEFNSAKD